MEKQQVHGDWRFLIILDACRFDVFQEVSSRLGLNGELRKVRSATGETIGWYQKNWQSYYPKTCLLSAHPVSFWGNYEFHTHFGEAYKLWNEDLIDVYDDTANCIANAVNIIKKSRWNKYLLHLIPPHLPFIGVEGKAFLKTLGYPKNLEGEAICEALTLHGRENGWLELRNYYEESLESVLKLLQQYGDIFHGETFITSDHGELIGEHDYYFHGAEGLKYPMTDELHEVPWFHWKT